jgi:PHD/YefM family antitoxin component YafN of YafNO toxin-antitoxin module
VVSKSIPITKARSEITRLPEQFSAEGWLDAVAITRRGKPVLAIMPWDLYDGLVETLEILGDEGLMAALRKSLREMESGKLVPLDEVKARL